ncbi:MAG: cytochrome b/b6 domain-containing protein [Bryobacteraceae bacterium]
MQIVRQKHLIGTRWFHWINFPLIFVMIWSGMLIYWAFPTYSIGPIHFFPRWVYNLMNIPQRLAEGMALHFFFMWLFVLNGVLYVSYTVVSGEWRYLVPQSSSVFRDAWFVVMHDLRLKRDLPPQEKYNAAQQIAYTAIVLMGAGSVLTGLAVYKPAQLGWLTALFGGYETARMFHFTLTVLYLVFFAVHVAQVIVAGWNNFRSMMSGWEMVNEEERTPAS